MAPISETNLSNVDLNTSSLVRAILRNANPREGDLEEAVPGNADLQGAEMAHNEAKEIHGLDGGPRQEKGTRH